MSARGAVRRLRGPVAIACGALAMLSLAAPDRAPTPAPAAAAVQDQPLLPPTGVRSPELIEEGRRLFLDTCSSCHGEDARGIPGRAPSLRAVGELSADWYLRTNRMPLDDPQDQPRRHPQGPFTRAQKRALVAYVGTFGGPRIPVVDPSGADVARGKRLFTEHCAGCHQAVARGGIVPGGQAPDLEGVVALDIAEALDIGPYVMPNFRHLDDLEVNAIARYVEYAQDPEDRGGWGIGHIGPIPEGLVTWGLATIALLIGMRIIGERTTE